MAVFKCKMCGGTLEFNEGDSIAVCDSCGSRQTLPSANDEVIINLHNRANTLRLKCEFDKAEEIYNKILEQNPNDAEAHWGIILCKYGIEYVEDPKTYKRIPTCHRTSFDAISADEDYKAAVAAADGTQRALYEAEAKEIDNIQKNILAIVKNEKPFDVFICYKETGFDGKRTQDSVLANDIYYQLTREGFKVFYAAITLEDKIGQEYEPYIFAALNSAKVMLVVGSKPEYFSAVWVKNEWSRFLKLMKTDRKKMLIPCYMNMDAYEMPEEFAHLQAQDMSRIGFINDLVRGIKKVAGGESPQNESVKTRVEVQTGASVAPLLERAFIFLEDGNWQDANEYCEKALDIDPKNAKAYLGKLMAELHIATREQWNDCGKCFDGSDNYAKVLRFGDENLVAEVKKYNEIARLNEIYNNAVSLMNYEDADEEDLAEAARIFDTVSGHRDSAEKARKCREAVYDRADRLMNGGNADDNDLTEAIRVFEIISDFGNSAEKAERCRNFIVYNGALRLMNCENADEEDLTSAIRTFESMNGFENSDELICICHEKIEALREKIEAEKEAARIKNEQIKAILKKCFKIGTPVLCACIAFVLLLINVIIPTQKYTKALALYEAKKYEEATAAFNDIYEYKDSEEYIKDIKYKKALVLYEAEKYEEATAAFKNIRKYKDSEEYINNIIPDQKYKKVLASQVGEVVTFGDYDWIVLEKNDDNVLIISKDIVTDKEYNSTRKGVTWETCSLRKWLNGEFLSSAFSDYETSKIAETTVKTPDKPRFGTVGGNDTTDKIFLLSIDEAKKYFSSDSARATGSWWWLRSPGFEQEWAANINYDGSVTLGSNVDRSHGVRPALWVNLKS